MMRTISHTTFTTIKTEGGILPADLLRRIAEGRDLDGLRPEDYHLFPGERLNEAINRAWNRCLGAWQAFDAQRARLPESDRGTSLTRERWLLVLFQELGYGRLQFVGSLAAEARIGESAGERISGEADQRIGGGANQRISESANQRVSSQKSKIQNHPSPAHPLTRFPAPSLSPLYPISHLWQQTPIHLVSFRQELDRKGFESRSPHSLMQEFLNRSAAYLWGIVSNGLRLRVLRDNVSLTRAAFVEFDLEAMMTGEQYADFAVLWLLCHQSRVEPVEGTCWLERWSQAATDQGVRALDALRDGVQEAIAALGRGFLAQRANAGLRAQLKSGGLTTSDYYRQLLRIVYRLIFLLVAEDRELLIVKDDGGTAGHYEQYYSITRLREMAAAMRGGPHADLYRGMRLLFTLLRTGYAPLRLPALGSFLFSAEATPALDGAELANADLLDAIRALTLTTEGNVRRPVDYRNLGSEELGSVYESLLELHPQLNVDAAAFTLTITAGSERKTTGSHYTPTSLIQALLDSALEPVVEARLQMVGQSEGGTRRGGEGETRGQGDAVTPSPRHPLTPSLETALLSIKVLDPACGSGHFLVGAAHRLARHLARIRTGDLEPAPSDLRAALRDVVRHCIHGVDLNPMAVELCKVALWMETLDPGKPLSFLERNIQCGNSLFGATPALLRRGIPDEAFAVLTGDDPDVCKEARKQNKRERAGQLSLFQPDLQPWEHLGNLAGALLELDTPEETLDDVRRKETRYAELVQSAGYRFGQLLADAWCAAFVWPKDKSTPYPLTEETFRRLERNPYDLPKWMAETIARLRERYAFFHWHLAYPGIFTPSPPAPLPQGEGRQSEGGQSEDGTGWTGGFDVVVGNPPWERIKLQEKEFFAQRSPEIAGARTAAEREKLIKALPQNDPALHQAYRDALRDSEAQSHFLRAGGRYPQSAVGDINTYQVFAGLARQLRGERGRVGVVLPTGIATDYYNKDFFGALVEGRELASLYDFENRTGLFPAVDSRMKFCLLTLTGPETPVDAADFAFFLHQTGDLHDPERRFTLAPADFRRINPNTQTCPVFRTRRDAELTRQIYERVPVLIDEATGENPWGVTLFTMFHSANAAHLFLDAKALSSKACRKENLWQNDEKRYLPLYEGKMFHQFDHRFASVIMTNNLSRPAQPVESTIEEHKNPSWLPEARAWVDESEIDPNSPAEVHTDWFMAYKDVTSSTNERTLLASVLPRVAIVDSVDIIGLPPYLEAWKFCGLLGNLNSFALDYVARQKVGGVHIKFYLFQQLPVLPPTTYDEPCPWESADHGSRFTYQHFILPRVLELTYTAWDLQPFAQDCGYDGPPFIWNEERRFLLRCELDAAYFHLYGIERADVDYTMETFPIVKRKDEAAHGEYRTKRVILEMYDEMARGEYRTQLDPPAGERVTGGGGDKVTG
ncbi:MAG: SAM-dependent DNA methyltransferase [Anaerolineae bacterium]|nr:SAM-dependent DNA methyltransferase [Anaerolineae bacterium]